MMKKRRIAVELPYFDYYMNTIRVTFRDTTWEKYCSCGHYEYKNRYIRVFSSKIWAIESPNHTQLSIFVNVKIVFYHKFINQVAKFSDKTINSVVLIFVVLDRCLWILNPFLYCKYRSCNSEKSEVKKTRKKVMWSCMGK